ncbi:ThuA domain-containing protein [Synoicihabitans lomoniglobus]|uniref:ThuA domain-containing protein n=1 Tax=Synoicihabitans lomoniglobus TaxID=2909285 RepID=A0AAF0CPK1_9BACT|nr:ThuA domain-containing protein [Opitutaceae bacterium LMO-M01]WED65164.1 ThuA domain-containing protein [Opitutaceae bacterium LMO-M01]
MKQRSLLTAFTLLAAMVVSASAAQFKALLITNTDGWHHDSISAAVPAMQEMAKLHDFTLVWPNNLGVISDQGLADVDVIVFVLSTGNILNDEQQAAVERFVQNGGGIAGVHSGGTDTEYDWDWWTKGMGHMFHIHPAVQTATVEVLDYNFPGMDRFSKRFLATEEWYEFDAARSDSLHYLLAVDESTYAPAANWGAKQGKGMGDFHPMSWCHEYDGGRIFYTAFGHLPATYSDASFLHHVYGGIYWAATGKGFTAAK